MIIFDVPVPYTFSNNASDLINYNDLKEDVVRSWAENGLILSKGEDAITNIQNELEKEIDKKLLLPPETSLPWQNNNN